MGMCRGIIGRILLFLQEWVGQKSRSDRDWKERDPPNRGCRGRDWKERDPPNRGCRGLGWGQSFEERRLRVTKSPLLGHPHGIALRKGGKTSGGIVGVTTLP